MNEIKYIRFTPSKFTSQFKLDLEILFIYLNKIEMTVNLMITIRMSLKKYVLMIVNGLLR